MARLRIQKAVVSEMLETALVAVTGVTFLPRREATPVTPESGETTWCRMGWRVKYGDMYTKSDGGPVIGELTAQVTINVPCGLVDDNAYALEEAADLIAAAFTDKTLLFTEDGPVVTHHITLQEAEFDIVGLIEESPEGEGGVLRRFEQGVLVVTGQVQRIA